MCAGDAPPRRIRTPHDRAFQRIRDARRRGKEGNWRDRSRLPTFANGAIGNPYDNVEIRAAFAWLTIKRHDWAGFFHERSDDERTDDCELRNPAASSRRCP